MFFSKKIKRAAITTLAAVSIFLVVQYLRLHRLTQIQLAAIRLIKLS